MHEVESFLGASEDNVAVIHCRAGKGRTGTLAICYLLALPTLPEPPKSALSPSSDREGPRSAFWASGNPKVRVASQKSTPPSPPAEDGLEVAADGANDRGPALSDEPGPLRGGIEDAQATEDDVLKGTSLDSTVDAAVKEKGDGSSDDASALLADRIKFLLHLQCVTVIAAEASLMFGRSASRRMADPTITYGVSIPSQRRWIRYWGQMLTSGDPRSQVAGRRIRILWVKIDMPKDGIAGVPGGNRVAIQVLGFARPSLPS